jgi:hypothetical protein
MSSAAVATTLSKMWTHKHTAGCMAAVFGIVLIALVGAPSVISWFLYMILIATFTFIAADGITDSKVGILIDERNRMSLSRLQMALWSLLIISAFLAAAVSNTRANAPQPLNIGVPEAVWMLMGISTTALVGSPLILSTKRAPAGGAASQTSAPHPTSSPLLNLTTPGPTSTATVGSTIPPVPPRPELPLSVASVLQAQGENPRLMYLDGSLVIRHSILDARWADLFKGDEAGDVATLDLAKIQMFFFTIVLVLAYAIGLGAKFMAIDAARRDPATESVATSPALPGKPAPPDRRLFDQFPPLDLGFVTILGISNAGFLGNRAVPRDKPSS